MACANLWPNLIIVFCVRVTRILTRFGWKDHKWFVKWFTSYLITCQSCMSYEDWVGGSIMSMMLCTRLIHSSAVCTYIYMYIYNICMHRQLNCESDEWNLTGLWHMGLIFKLHWLDEVCWYSSHDMVMFGVLLWTSFDMVWKYLHLLCGCANLPVHFIYINLYSPSYCGNSYDYVKDPPLNILSSKMHKTKNNKEWESKVLRNQRGIFSRCYILTQLNLSLMASWNRILNCLITPMFSHSHHWLPLCSEFIGLVKSFHHGDENVNLETLRLILMCQAPQIDLSMSHDPSYLCTKHSQVSTLGNALRN